MVINHIIKNTKSSGLFLATIVLSLLSVFNPIQTQAKNYVYYKNGIGFVLPTGWSLVSDEITAEKDTYIISEKNWRKSNATFAVLKLDKITTPTAALIMQQSKLKESAMYQPGGIDFTAISEAKIDGIASLMVNYEAIVSKSKVKGSIYAFNYAGHTYLLFFQSNLIREKESQSDIDKIRKSFSCK